MTVNPLVKHAVRAMFTFISAGRAANQAGRLLDAYLDLAAKVRPEQGETRVTVPALPGVDQDMRDWSLYMIFEHNTLVNGNITALVTRLAQGEPLGQAAAVNPKTDLDPSPEASIKTVEAFERSVRHHLQAVGGLARLRWTSTFNHPVFGVFDAHKWHCMFSFHLKIHYKQAQHVVRLLEPQS